jgi:hypothetical protein
MTGRDVLAVLCCLIGCLQAVPAKAEPQVFAAGKGLEIVVGLIARLKVASELCGYSNIAPWESIIEAIDRRYAHCLAQDARWSDLMSGQEANERNAKAKGLPAGIGSVVLRLYRAETLADAHAAGVTAYCDRFPWKWVLEPDPENARARADYVKAEPRNEVSTMLGMMEAVERLPRGAAWIDAPCDRDFWQDNHVQ